ncbi:hypothetical protein BKA69DRAFT_497589 [Paraphysoderma sedebokerense]|nr:hypothetical protein BKA69DRAFT_497589 [Paraphysoderma sedebokerense]
MSMISTLGPRASNKCSQPTVDPSPALIAATSNTMDLSTCNANKSQMIGQTDPHCQQRNGQPVPLKIKIIRPSEPSIKSTDVRRSQSRTRNRHAKLVEPSSDVTNESAQTKQARNQNLSDIRREAIIEPVLLHNPSMASDDQIRRSSRQRKPINKDILDDPLLTTHSTASSSNPAKSGETNQSNEHITAESVAPVSVPTKRKRLSSSELSSIPAELPLIHKDGATPLATSFDRNTKRNQVAGREVNLNVLEFDKEQKKPRMREKLDDNIAVPNSSSIPVEVNQMISSQISGSSFSHSGISTAQRPSSKLVPGTKEKDSKSDPNLVAPTQSDCTDDLQGRSRVSKKKTETKGNNVVSESVVTKSHMRVNNPQEYDGLSWEHVSYGGFFI